ncbi:MAG: cytochrome c biogenesis protein CcsA [Fimbriimonadaceae bacterium]|nr:cytochrome c biogenesis protein CcsA [Fimbriimonadaceae bacterium]
MEEQTLDLSQFSEAPQWSVLLGNGFGRWLILAGFALFLLSAVAWILSPRNPRYEKIGRMAFTHGSATIFGAFVTLAILFINNRFEYYYVWSHSDTLNSLQYKIAAIWSGQEGSFMLWAVAAAIFGLLTVRGTGPYRRWFTVVYALFLGGLCGVMSYESAFRLVDSMHGKTLVPIEGAGLSPSLLNYWIVIHPPTIFLGFGSLTVLFAYAVAAFIEKNPVEWVPRARPWAIVSLTFLGVGLCMGGFWAYETLGWGGFWAWDPVENTSFVPWVFLAILIHGFLIQQAKKRWYVSNLVFAGLPFLMFLYGTFLTRSGMLGNTSVHSFAQMDNKALKLLVGMCSIFVIGFIGLAIWRGRHIRKEFAPQATPETSGVAREKMYLLGSYALTFFAISTAVGMSVPFIQGIFHQPQKVVEEGLYHNILVWPFIPIMLLMAAAPFVSWRGTSWKELLNKLYLILCVTIFTVGILGIVIKTSSVKFEADLSHNIAMPFGRHLPAYVWTLILAGLCIFVVVAHLWKAIELYRKNRPSVAGFMSHVGLGITLAGLVISRGLETEQELITQKGKPSPGLGYAVNFIGPTKDYRDRTNRVEFQMIGDGGSFTARPSLYYREQRDPETGQTQLEPFAWPYIHRGLLNDVYFTLGAMQLNATDLVSIKPDETIVMDSFKVTYLEMIRTGNPGQVGTEFGAKLKFVSDTGEEYVVTPKMRITDSGPTFDPDFIGTDYFITIQRLDAGTKAAWVQLHFMEPLWPIKLYYKPFVGLVWLGTGIMALAGLFAAWNRKSRRATPTEDQTKEETGTSPQQ